MESIQCPIYLQNNYKNKSIAKEIKELQKKIKYCEKEQKEIFSNTYFQ